MRPLIGKLFRHPKTQSVTRSPKYVQIVRQIDSVITNHESRLVPLD
jgi:hypothetical protein